MKCHTCGVATSNPRFCSRSCSAKTTNKIAKRKTKPPAPRRCANCQQWTLRKKFCSQSCAGQGFPRAALVPHPCAQCKALTKNKRFCSVQCCGLAQRKVHDKAAWSSAANNKHLWAPREHLSKDALAAILGRQEGMCAICRRRPATVIDHCHETGKVRGWLCRGCNSALGTLGDTVESLTRALDYLKQPVAAGTELAL